MSEVTAINPAMPSSSSLAGYPDVGGSQPFASLFSNQVESPSLDPWRASTATDSSLKDYQGALNAFGRIVGEAKQGDKFGTEDMARFKEGIDAYLARGDVSEGVKAALREIAAKFEASGDGTGVGGFDSKCWADFLEGVGGLLRAVNGGEEIGQKFLDLSKQFRDSYNDADGKFGTDDMNALRNSGNDLVRDLDNSFRGSQVEAKDFGRFFEKLQFDGEATPSSRSYPPASSFLGAANSTVASVAGDNNWVGNVVNVSLNPTGAMVAGDTSLVRIGPLLDPQLNLTGDGVSETGSLMLDAASRLA